jgi:hypothetical protein
MKKDEVRYIAEDFFNSREEVKTEIRKCAMMAGIITLSGALFALIGVIGDALNMIVILESSIWLLLAIFFGVVAIFPTMHSVMAKHLYGIESERKK